MIRRYADHLIINMGIPIPGKDVLFIEMGPWFYSDWFWSPCKKQCKFSYICSVWFWNMFEYEGKPSEVSKDISQIQGPILIISVPADVLVSNGARPSAGTGITIKSDVILSYFLLVIDAFEYSLCWSNNIVSSFLRQLPPPPPQQNGPHFADNIFRCIFMNEKLCIFIELSLKCVPKVSIDNNPALV